MGTTPQEGHARTEHGEQGQVMQGHDKARTHARPGEARRTWTKAAKMWKCTGNPRSGTQRLWPWHRKGRHTEIPWHGRECNPRTGPGRPGQGKAWNRRAGQGRTWQSQCADRTVPRKTTGHARAGTISIHRKGTTRAGTDITWTEDKGTALPVLEMAHGQHMKLNYMRGQARADTGEGAWTMTHLSGTWQGKGRAGNVAGMEREKRTDITSTTTNDRQWQWHARRVQGKGGAGHARTHDNDNTSTTSKYRPESRTWHMNCHAMTMTRTIARQGQDTKVKREDRRERVAGRTGRTQGCGRNVHGQAAHIKHKERNVAR